MDGQHQSKSQTQPKNYLGKSATSNDPDLSKWTLDPQDISQFIDLSLQGAIFSPNEKGQLTYSIPKKGDTPLYQRLNDFGRNIVMSTIRAIFHRGTILSDLDSKQISILTQTVHRKVVVALLRNWRKVGVRTPLEVPKIVYENVSMNVFTTLNRAKGGITWKKLSEIHVVREDISHTSKGPTSGSGISTIFQGLGGP